MKSIELALQSVFLASRWVLVIFFGGLLVALGMYAAHFVSELVHLFYVFWDKNEGEMIVTMLSMIDAALVASLTLMVMLSSFENFVSKFDNAGDTLKWLGKLDSGSLKIKVASAIIAISSIHLLQAFLNVNAYTNQQMGWFVIIHLTFLLSALLLAYLDQMNPKYK